MTFATFFTDTSISEGAGVTTSVSGTTTTVTLTSPVSPAHGGTGVTNTGAITVGGNTTFSGAYTFTGTLTANTNVTFPASGTLATTAGTVSSVSGTANIITSTGGSTPVISIAGTYLGQASITTLGTITTGAWNGSTVTIAHGGTGVTSVTTTPTASAFAGWDANKNISANNVIEAYATTATSTTAVTLTVASAAQQYFTGNVNQTIILPVASTLVLGQSFTIVNNSRAIITVESSGANVVQAIDSGNYAIFTCILTSGTDATSWNVEYALSTPLVLNALSLAGNPTGGSNLPSSIGLVSGQLAFSGASIGLDPRVATVLADIVLDTSQITGMNAVPFAILSALANGYQYYIESVQFAFANTNPYVGGGDVYFQYGSASGASNVDATQRLPVATFIDLSTPTDITPQWTLPGGFSTNTANFTDGNVSQSGVGLYVTNATAPFTGGFGNSVNVVVIGYIYAPQI